ncbi:MAG: hypothetical protein KDA21_03225 [Phycisphaerales bacterium]|nr:hypothetical protein [Phycisphaerales bacterium]
MRLPILLLLTATCVFSSGCSSLIRGMVNTQPRVELEESAYGEPGVIVKGQPILYQPMNGGTAMDPDLVRHAPIIVQGRQDESQRLRYDTTSDLIGTPMLSTDGGTVRIATDEPAVFARVEHPMYNGVPTKSLVYVFWYPERPVGSIEKGKIDGGILRITLDQQGQPAVFEYSQPCGCFHGVFVSRDLEDRARAQFSELEEHRLYAVEPALEGDDWVVRDLVEVLPGGRITLYMSAGKHFCEAMHYEANAPEAELFAASEAYDLRPYEELEMLARDGGGNGSMFNDAGLVLGGKRWKEEIALSDLDNPGWPRRLDAMKIHWDAETWNDPNLIDRHLRIPGEVAAQAGRESMPLMARLPLVASDSEQGHQLVMFTNRYCEGCQVAKALVSRSPEIQAAMNGWEYVVVDTATPEGAARAAAHHVTVVPVLIGMTDGAEVFRTENLETEQVIASTITAHAEAH